MISAIRTSAMPARNRFQAAMAEAGGFDHNAHTLRLLTRLECPYPNFAGLNLSWEMLEGLPSITGR